LRRPKAAPAGFLVVDWMIMIALPFMGRFQWNSAAVPLGCSATDGD
jgi:hypothetical protein